MKQDLPFQTPWRASVATSEVRYRCVPVRGFLLGRMGTGCNVYVRIGTYTLVVGLSRPKHGFESRWGRSAYRSRRSGCGAQRGQIIGSHGDGPAQLGIPRVAISFHHS